MRQRRAPYMGCGRRFRAFNDKCRSYKPIGLTPRAGKVKAGEDERGGKTRERTGDSSGQRWLRAAEVDPQGSHLKM